MASQRPPLITTSGQSHCRATTFSWKELTSSLDSDMNQIKTHSMTTRKVKTQKLGSYRSSHSMSTRLGGVIKDKNVPVQSVNEQMKHYKEKPTKLKCRNSS